MSGILHLILWDHSSLHETETVESDLLIVGTAVHIFRQEVAGSEGRTHVNLNVTMHEPMSMCYFIVEQIFNHCISVFLWSRGEGRQMWSPVFWGHQFLPSALRAVYSYFAFISQC